MHELDGNLIIESTQDAYSGQDGGSPSEVDIKDSQNVKLAVSVGTNASTDDIVVALQGADESSGSFSTLTATDGNDATVTFSGTGFKEVEVSQPPRYVKGVVTSSQDSDDTWCSVIVAGNAETLPVE